MNRAYSTLTVKAVQDGEERVIEGIASTPALDRDGDIIEPMGAKFALPLPLLWQHKADQPVGTVEFAKPNEKGIPFRARLATVDEPGRLKDRVDEAWQSVKAGLVRGVSIGFQGAGAPMKNGGRRFSEWSWLELSLVTIPANAEATISAIKSISHKQIAASGDGENRPGVSGAPVKLSTKGAPVMALAEQIASLEAKRAANAARMEEVATKSIDRGETMAADEQDEFDGLEAEVKQIDADLARLRTLEKMKLTTAKPVSGAKAADGDSRDPHGVPAQVRLAEKLEPGIGFARLARVKALAKLEGESTREVAKSLYGESSSVYGVFVKAPVPAGSTQDGNWGNPLVGDGTNVYADFVEYLRPRTILGRFGTDGIPALRRVPFNVPLIGQTGGGDGYWVGEGQSKPLTSFEFTRSKLDIFKVANIAVVTEELLRDSSPAADGVIRDQLAAALAERLDRDFIDPAKAAGATSPGSITNGLTPVASTGGTADDIRADIQALFGEFIAANNAPTTGVWIVSSTTALRLSMMTNPLGQPEFGGMTMRGGTIAGLPAIVSDYVPAGMVILANASDIYLADDGGVQVDMSREASLEMADNPAHNSTTPTGSTSMVSMFQTNSIAFRAERFINWARRRPSAAAVITQATWAGYVATP